ncbi:hypothetical protein IWC96_10010 [Brevundimonas sp. BAL450]|uniref:hypothetical protein n=1 Tax=Brevundimonas sp. BAL450 TaxID=1708162 RepID=UPI0018C97768|nr:hypothetical protein [Brevundimonas sp. BAL450]MBG7615612.1 hypothetical protein [Brevundimonas sp. BAL450]
MTHSLGPDRTGKTTSEFTLAGGFARRGRRKPLFCLYCGRPADTYDHVPPKVLLETPYPPNLRMVPACQPCNGGWSSDEDYVVTVLAYIGATSRLQAKAMEGGKVDRSLVGAPLFEDRLIRSLSVTSDGEVAISVEMDRIATVTEKIVMGLHALRYGRGPEPEAFSCIAVVGPGREPPPALRAALGNWPGMKPKRWTTVQAGVFGFVFVRAPSGDAPLWCVINLHETLVVVVRCPAPVVRTGGRLASPPW